jgi:hypothetical protein
LLVVMVVMMVLVWVLLLLLIVYLCTMLLLLRLLLLHGPPLPLHLLAVLPEARGAGRRRRLRLGRGWCSGCGRTSGRPTRTARQGFAIDPWSVQCNLQPDAFSSQPATCNLQPDLSHCV